MSLREALEGLIAEMRGEVKGNTLPIVHDAATNYWADRLAALAASQGEPSVGMDAFAYRRLLQRVWADYGRSGDISATNLEAIEKALELPVAAQGGESQDAPVREQQPICPICKLPNNDNHFIGRLGATFGHCPPQPTTPKGDKQP